MDYTNYKRVFDKDGNILKAGAIVVKNEGNAEYCLLTYRKIQNDYSFPKGHLDEGESPEEAAVREVMEETGCLIEIVRELVPFYYEHPDSGKCKVFMFVGKLVSEGKGIEENEELAWIPVDEVVDRLTYQNLKDFFIENKDKLCLKK